MCAPHPFYKTQHWIQPSSASYWQERKSAGCLGYVMSCHVVYLGLNLRTCLSSEPVCFEQLVNSVTFEFRPRSNTGTLERRRTNNSTMILLPPPFIHSPKSDICRWFLIARLRCPSYSSCPSSVESVMEMTNGHVDVQIDSSLRSQNVHDHAYYRDDIGDPDNALTWCLYSSACNFHLRHW